LSLVERHL